jgi:hypothetical protein
MVSGGNHIGNLMTSDLITTHTPRELGYPNSDTLFSLSLTGTAFAWYATLPPNSILSWGGELEQKFHDHFFSGDYELDLVDLVALQQGKDESVNEYIRRFRDTRN